MKKTTKHFGAILVLIIIAGYFVFTAGSNQVVASSGNGNVQVVKLSVVNGNYVLSPSEIKKGVPVRLEADMAQMPGCSKSVVIPAFDIRKTFGGSDNTIEFIPDKAGTFNIACSMNMYRGTFTVLESDGSKSNYVDNTAPSGASCGASGGCGCGG